MVTIARSRRYVEKLIHAVRVAAYEFRTVMSGRPASRDRIPHFESMLKGSREDFRYVQPRMIRFRKALESIDDDAARAALDTRELKAREREYVELVEAGS